MAKYLILIYGPESATPPTPDQWDQMMQAHGRFAQAVDQQGGKTLGGEALQPTATGRSWTPSQAYQRRLVHQLERMGHKVTLEPADAT